MTQPKSPIDAADQAAYDYVNSGPLPGPEIRAFKAGVRWRDTHPSEAVAELVEMLERSAEALGTLGHEDAAQEIDELLARFRGQGE